MDSKEFVAAYDTRIPDQRRLHQPLPELMAESRIFSERFGQLLHTYLENPGEPAIDQDLMQEYDNWLGHNFQVVNTAINHLETREGFKANSEFNFHRLNAAMIAMWVPVLAGHWPPGIDGKHRKYVISHAQNLVAIHGLREYYQREQHSGIQAGHRYFSPMNDQVRAVFEGSLNEFDAAIVLLEIVKRDPSLTVVPAPLQFEHDRERYNVDFVVVSETGHAIGIQVKSSVNGDKKTQYDQTRVVLLDAKIDFGNVLAKRTQAGSSHIKQVGWAGLICAERASMIASKGPAQSLFALERLDLRTINRHKMLAKQLLRGIRPNLSEVVERVGPRVLSRL